MNLVEKKIEGVPDKLKEALQELCSRLKWGLKQKENRFTIRSGDIVSFHPDFCPIQISIHVTGNDAVLSAKFRRRKTGRIAEHRIGVIYEFLVALKGGAAIDEAARRAQSVTLTHLPETSLQTIKTGAILLASAWLCFCASTIAITFCAYFAIDRTVGELHERCKTLEYLRILPTPPMHEVSSLDAAFKINCAFLLAFPVAFFNTFVFVVGAFISEHVRFLSFLPQIVLLFVLVASVVVFAAPANPAVAIGASVAQTFLIYWIYKGLWYLKGERKFIQSKLTACMQMSTFVLPLLVIAFVPKPNVYRNPSEDAALSFRDDFLLSNPSTKLVADFYYRHTLYPADILKEYYSILQNDPAHRPPLKDQVTAFVGMPHNGISEILREQGFSVDYSTDDAGSMKKLTAHAYDYFIIDEGFSESARYLRDNGLLPRTIVIPRGKKMEKGALLLELQTVNNRIFRGNFIRSYKDYGFALFLPGMVYFILLFPYLAFKPGVFWGARRSSTSAYADIAAAVVLSIAVFVFFSSKVNSAESQFYKFDDAALIDYLRKESADSREAYSAIRELWFRIESAKKDGKQFSFDENAIYGAIKKYLVAPDVRARMWAHASLAFCGQQAYGDILNGFKDPELYVRYKSAEAAGKGGFRAAVPRLQELVRDDCWYVAAYASSAISELVRR